MLLKEAKRILKENGYRLVEARGLNAELKQIFTDKNGRPSEMITKRRTDAVAALFSKELGTKVRIDTLPFREVEEDGYNGNRPVGVRYFEKPVLIVDGVKYKFDFKQFVWVVLHGKSVIDSNWIREELLAKYNMEPEEPKKIYKPSKEWKQFWAEYDERH